MIEPTLTWVEATKNAVQSLQQSFQVNRGMLLTEGDLECHLFNELLNQPELSGFHASKNDSVINRQMGNSLKTSYVHSQVTWFKPDKKSGFKVDLTIGDPKLLEVANIELFEKYTSKGFAYDGPCVAIELKFIRNEDNASYQAQEDFLKLLNDLIPAKFENIEKENYMQSNRKNVAFISIVGCKNKAIFNKAKHYLGKHLSNTKSKFLDYINVGIFYQDELTWEKTEIIKHYKEYNGKDNN